MSKVVELRGEAFDLSDVRADVPSDAVDDGAAPGAAAAGAEDDEFADALDDVAAAAALKDAGNSLFRDSAFDAASERYSDALALLGNGGDGDPDAPMDEPRLELIATLLANRAACGAKLSRHDEVVSDCTAALEAKPRYVKALLRRAAAHEALERYDEAIIDMEAAVEAEPPLPRTAAALAKLKAKRHDDEEAMRGEAMGKLKDLGNSVLGNFGLSMDNFKMDKQPGGGYSVSYDPGK
ncbi:hypothetical protein M885DRAFT_508578 [Pelagophyceae sp. CCMP2097]|nr:hypothetical protein M885DRAFT_508578 [Pelagophyceae sp. CCMP2097]